MTTTTAPPLTLHPNAAAVIPDSLKSRRRWICWRLEGGRKIPKCPRNPKHAGGLTWKDTSRWADFESAFHSARAAGPDFGIGFVLVGEDGLIGGDFDGALNPDGTALPWAHNALAMLDQLDTYSEVSPRSVGVRFFAEGTLPGQFSEVFGTGKLEAWHTDHWMTITGRHLGGEDVPPLDFAELLKTLPPTPPPNAATNGTHPKVSPAKTTPGVVNPDGTLNLNAVDDSEPVADLSHCATLEEAHAALIHQYREHKVGEAFQRLERHPILIEYAALLRDNRVAKDQAAIAMRGLVDQLARVPWHERVVEYSEGEECLRDVYKRTPRVPHPRVAELLAFEAAPITVGQLSGEEHGTTTPNNTPEPWGTPRPLDSEPEVPPLPAAILSVCPDWLLDLIVAASESFELPEDLAFLAALASLSTVSLGAVTVRSYDKHPSQPVNFYGLATGRPGAGKSSVLRTFTRPLDQLETDRLTQARRDYARTKAAQGIRAKRITELERKASRGDEAAASELLALAEADAEADTPPPRSRLLTQATPEAVASVAAANRGQFALTTAEPQGLAEVLGTYRDTGPRVMPEVFTAGFDGDALRQARATEGKSREIAQVHGVFLVLSQKDMLDKILADGTFAQSGFVSRCFLAMPPTPERSADPFEGKGIPNRIVATYGDQLTRLGRWLGQFANPGTVTYSREALQELAPLYAEMKSRRDTPGGDLHKLAISLVRVEQIAARIGALIHVAREGDRCFERPVPGDIGAALVGVGRYHCGHAKAMLGGQSPAHKLAKRILQFALGEGGLVDWRTLQQAFKGGTQWDHADEAVAILTAHQLARTFEKSPGPQGGRPRRFLETNPELRATK